MRSRYVFLISSLSLFIGFLIGKNHANFALFLQLDKLFIFLKDKKYLFEIVYLTIASLIIPIAYFQYRHEKKKEKRGAVEYAHQLFRQYSEEILLQEKKFDHLFLEKLSPTGDKDKLREFNEMLNKLDAFAAAFMHGIADFEAGRLMMGNTYCDQIQSYLPAIKRISKENYREGLENLFGLWEKWKSTDG